MALAASLSALGPPSCARTCGVPALIATPSTKIENLTKERFMFGSPLGNERLTGIVPGRWPGITLLPEWRYATLNHASRYVYL